MEAQFKKAKKWFQNNSMRSVSYDRQGIKPTHDWMILLVLTAIMLCVVGGSSYYLYTRIDTDTLFPAIEDADAKEEVVNAELLQNAIGWIDAKAATTTELGDNKNIPSDPSL